MRKALALAAGLALFATALLRLPSAVVFGQGQSVVGTGIVSQGASLPATCNPATGDISQKVFFMTSGGSPGLYYCSAANTWTAAGGTPGTTINPTNNVLPKRSNATTFVDSDMTDDGSLAITAPNRVFRVSSGSSTNISYAFQNATNTGMWRSDVTSVSFVSAGSNQMVVGPSNVIVANGIPLNFSAADGSAGTSDTSIGRASAGVLNIGNGTASDKSGTLQAAKYNTGTNCSSSASPAVCASAAAGSVAVPTGTNPTLVVNTTAVTANSQIMLQSDESLGTKLSVTCNTTLGIAAAEPVVTARTAATSFTIQISGTVSTNPACVSYFIVN